MLTLDLFFQFAGGFDAESMKAFEELRSRVNTKSADNNKLELQES